MTHQLSYNNTRPAVFFCKKNTILNSFTKIDAVEFREEKNLYPESAMNEIYNPWAHND